MTDANHDPTVSGALLRIRPAQALQLASGDVLLAKVTDATGQGLRVERLDNGGVLELRWDHLTAPCALSIKQAWGLAGEEQGELTATVLDVRYMVGGAMRSIIGARDDELSTKDHLVVRQKGLPYKVPIADLLEVREVEVPVTQVFTLDEFYSRRLQEQAPGESPDAHVLLAADLIKVRDYERAAEHLGQAKGLHEEHGTSRAPEQIDRLLKQLQRYREAKKELDLIDEIKVCRARGTVREFARGLEQIAKYEEEFPSGKLRSDFETEQRRFLEARRSYFSQQVAEAWRRGISYVAERKVQEPGITLDAAKQYAEQEMGEDLAANVAERFELDVAEVKELWGARGNYPIGKRADIFTYGVGSWLLGKEAVIKGVTGAREVKDEGGGQSREMENLARRLRRELEQRQAQAGRRGATQEVQSPDDWWKSAERVDRERFLRAYYAEFSGDLEIRHAMNQPCMRCSGAGSVLVPGPGGKIVTIDCPMCHATKFVRLFRAW